MGFDDREKVTLRDGKQIDAPRAAGSIIACKQASRVVRRVAEQRDAFDDDAEVNEAH
jgi:hypothetical protein